MKYETAEIISEIEQIIGRSVTIREEVRLIDAIEYEEITDPHELIKMFDL